MQVSWFRSGALLLLLAAAALGCGGPSKPVKTEGIVTIDGAPAPGVTVEFVPDDETMPSANGITDDDGKFRLTTYSTGDGAVPGDYHVVVKQDASETTAEKADTPQSITEAMKQHSGKMHKPNSKDTPKGLIHARYGKSSTTPLKQRVPTDGIVELKLSKKGG